MKPFFGAASFLLILSLLELTGGQPQQSVPGNFQTNRENRPTNLFNNNIDPFSRRPVGVGDNTNAIFEEP